MEMRQDIYAQFRALAQRHRTELSVNWGVGPMFGPFTVHSFYRNDLYGGAAANVKGNGAKALAEVCWLADQLQITLTLGTSQRPLIPYFEQFGFHVTQPMKPEGDDVAIMKRPVQPRHHYGKSRARPAVNGV